MTDAQIRELEDAGDTIYRYVDKEKGFYSGIWKDEKTGRTGQSWNSFTGAKAELEKKLERQLSKAEITILSLAIGFGPTPCLSIGQRKEAMEILWSRRQPDQRPGSYMPCMTVMTSFW